LIIQPELNSQNLYTVDLPAGDYMISPILDNSTYFTVSPEALSIDLGSVNGAEGEFCLQATTDSLLDNAIHVIPLDLARPGFEINHKIVITNNGNYTTSGQVTYSYSDNLVTYLNSTSPATELDGVVTIDYEDLAPFDTQEIVVTLRLNSPMDTPALDGDEVLYFKGTILDQQTDLNIRDNRYLLCEEVRNAYDPNDKTCLQGPYLLEEMIGDYLSYRIRFENTGNASAVNVRVIDEIDPEYFDISTLTILEASHAVRAQIRGNEVAFLFDDIYLPFEDEFNDGFVIFEVKTWDHLTIEDELENTADIYFDFNFPIITNTTSTVVVTDNDMDGYIHLVDCDDNDPTVYPSAEEILYNGIDDDCDPNTLDDDFDQDGYGILDDCDDSDSSINPDMSEIPYNSIDDDCNPLTLDDDLDGDGFTQVDDCDDTDANVNSSMVEEPYNGVDDDCNPETLDDDLDGDGYILADDCDDSDATINSDQVEVPYNGIDDDCDSTTFDDDLDQDGYLAADDCDDTNSAINPGLSEETYNGIDDDCNPETLDDDLDQDGYGIADDCDDTNALVNVEMTEVLYNGIDDDCDLSTLDDDLDQDGYNHADDCDDSDPDIYTGAVCDDGDDCTLEDSIDGDCNCVGHYQDSDDDGICDADDETSGDCTLGESCDDGDACTGEDKYDADCNCIGVFQDSDEDGVCNAEDCRPFNANVYPGNSEIPYNGLDDDCDETTLDDDLDQDGYLMVDDCDDANPTIYPSSACDDDDVCTTNDMYDSNCNCVGAFQDSDQDGICDAEDETNGDCTLGEGCDDGDPDTDNDIYDADCNCIGGQVLDCLGEAGGGALPNTPCDDGDPCTINDLYTEDCECLGEKLQTLNYYLDLDQDGYGAADSMMTNCELVIPEGYSDNSLDCDDTNSLINPDAEDIPNNGIDEDCDGQDALSSTHELDGQVIEIYPNPVSDVLVIDSGDSKSYHIQLYDLYGQLIYESEGASTIDCSVLRDGAYLLTLRHDVTRQSIVQRIIVSH